MEWTIDSDATAPPFEQLRQRIAEAAASGELPEGERLPTVRALAETLGLAVNTVARAYRELEAMGVIRTEGRRGSFIASTTLTHDETRNAAKAFAASAQSRGMGRAEAISLLESVW